MSSVSRNRVPSIFSSLLLWNILVFLLHIAKPFQWYYIFPLVICILNSIFLIVSMTVQRNDDSLSIKLADLSAVQLSSLFCFPTIIASFFTLPSYEYQAYDLRNSFLILLISHLVLSVLLYTMNILGVVGDEIVNLKRKSQE